ncbi:SDR family oxidoreductase [Zavarzinia sp. CC-PAN008]|uniref:SDR family oxidoreductase n=1 Tax=Zavarzinia sp. CC-PAN008 TaxID=3243332 RepID=UPI003F74AA8E
MTGAVLITGAAQRLGRAVALDLGAQGWRVAVHYRRSRADADAVVAAIRAQGGTAAAVQADLSIEADVQALVPQAVAAIGPLTCLVNNASEFEFDDAAGATRASWDLHMEANLRAPFVLMQAFAAQLPAERQGNIINLLDQRVWRLTPKFVSYTVSKAALWTLTQTMALALAPRIRVNGIGPGPTLPTSRQAPEHFRHQVESLPLQIQTPLADICAGVRFILGAPSFTGQMLALDGGQHLAWRTPDAQVAE